jgi:hypothetical protein
VFVCVCFKLYSTCQILMKLEFPPQVFEKYRVVPCGWADRRMNRRTDGWTNMMKIVIALCNFTNALKICRFILYGLFSCEFLWMSNYYKYDPATTRMKDTREECQIHNLNLLNPTGYVMHHQFTFNKCTLCSHCICVFCIYLKTNSDLYRFKA